MRSVLSFNVFFVQIMLVALGVTGFVVRQQLQRNAQDEVLQNARVMMETTTAARSYTTKQIAPLLEHERYRFDRVSSELQQTIDRHLPAAFQAAGERLTDPAQKEAVAVAQKIVVESVKQRPREIPEAEFHPQSVPAYSATEIFNYFRGQYPDYTYKEATLNPTNPRDRTVDWEADIVNKFRAQPDLTELYGSRQGEGGKMMYIGKPLKITNASCLVCHSTPDRAPPEMIKIYGSSNGFGWQMNEIVGAQIVSVPAALPMSIADRAFTRILLWMGGIFVLVVLLTNFALFGVKRVRTAAAARRAEQTL
ncbi:MAG: DUF3365 domain-containing protein [Verrucomicrobia bacterium]|nr:DUF3365 domain-containing protein [Verrucomicrobiota bacterium]